MKAVSAAKPAPINACTGKNGDKEGINFVSTRSTLRIPNEQRASFDGCGLSRGHLSRKAHPLSRPNAVSVSSSRTKSQPAKNREVENVGGLMFSTETVVAV